MLRLFFISLLAVLLLFAFLQSRLRRHTDELPVFLRSDSIADSHHTSLFVEVQSTYKPTEAQLDALKTDYSNLWAHLNHVYATNDVLAGKEYYTEGWFKQLCRHYPGSPHPALVTRDDLSHHIQIKNWSNDGLVCTAIDSSLVLTYTYPDKTTRVTTVRLAVALLYQGDHWRLDALRLFDEKNTTPTN